MATPRKRPEDKLKTGRPSDYRPEFCAQGAKLCALGAIDKDLCEFFGIVLQTLYNWREAHPEFLEACLRAKHEADSAVTRRLYERAMGYTHKAVKIFMPAGAKEPVYAEFEQHYPPDTQAATWWLKNRRPDLWKDKFETEHSGTVTLEAIKREDTDALQRGLIEGLIQGGIEPGMAREIVRAATEDGAGEAGE